MTKKNNELTVKEYNQLRGLLKRLGKEIKKHDDIALDQSDKVIFNDLINTALKIIAHRAVGEPECMLDDLMTDLFKEITGYNQSLQ